MKCQMSDTVNVKNTVKLLRCNNDTINNVNNLQILLKTEKN